MCEYCYICDKEIKPCDDFTVIQQDYNSESHYFSFHLCKSCGNSVDDHLRDYHKALSRGEID